MIGRTRQRRGGARHLLTQVAPALAAALFFTACGDAGNGSRAAVSPPPTVSPLAGEASPAAPQLEATVKMTDALRFEPEEVVVKVGGKVTWQNPSTVVHTATGDPSRAVAPEHVELPPGAEPWDSDFVQPGASFTKVFTAAGTYRYFCIPHETVEMVGVVKVVP